MLVMQAAGWLLALARLLRGRLLLLLLLLLLLMERRAWLQHCLQQDVVDGGGLLHVCQG